MRYLGLTNLVSGEDQYGSDHAEPGTELTAKSYSYDAWGHRISLTDDETQLGSGGTSDPDAESFTYAYDVHGSVSLLIDESSTATASYGYRPYGGANDALTAGDFDPSDSQEEAGREDDPLNAFRYSGRRLDTGSGSIDMGARRYGPDTGRFLQRDFLSSALGDLGLSLDPLTQGRYNFAGGNPISFVEWDGHIALLNGSGGGGRAGGTAKSLARSSRSIKN
jgi:RHS repeat-associated protein